ncbi:hypothetical protein [Roseivirga sp. UBA838]|uniref:hypothetical protein n=1 Tax=uncultured Roseivirga sp. TaxID=543088 RepID=UPI00257C296C|nr:hypothetical protein [Roseivirga sp. UBA838]
MKKAIESLTALPLRVAGFHLPELSTSLLASASNKGCKPRTTLTWLTSPEESMDTFNNTFPSILN